MRRLRPSVHPSFSSPSRSRNAALSVCIVRSQHYYGEAPHPLALLCPRRERPRGSRAAEQRDEVAALHETTAFTML
jgi:hypothetical protein